MGLRPSFRIIAAGSSCLLPPSSEPRPTAHREREGGLRHTQQAQSRYGMCRGCEVRRHGATQAPSQGGGNRQVELRAGKEGGRGREVW